MANETSTKVRLVRCPNCRQILQEHAEIPVYKCGGCGTVLQAKKKKNENSSPESSTHETTPASIERGQSSLEKDISSLHQNADSVSSESVLPIHHEHHGNSDKEIALGFDSISSTDSLQNILTDDNRSQPAITHRDMSRSYYAYDGSTSSCAGDDRVPNHFSRQYGHGSPSAYKKNVVHHQSGFHMSSAITDPEPDRTELLRMVYELEDQLQKTRLGKGNANNAPFFYNQFAAQANVSYSRCPARCGESSRIPFSGEAAHYRHQTNCLCLHCSPQVWHCSAQLPQGCIYCNTHHSGSSSPQHYTTSEYSSSVHDTKSSDQRHKDQEMKKLQLREKYAKRRVVLPVSGGAPIIACHYCSELLQMPADFGVFKRRWHQVRCNACMKVLKFSVQNRIHVMPYLAESVSYSDDLKPSFCLSGSSEAEASSNSSPIQLHGRNTLNRKVLSSPSSSEPMEDGKMKSVNGRIKSSSESEEALPRTGPPLHRLMGYSSLSQVLNQKCFE